MLAMTRPARAFITAVARIGAIGAREPRSDANRIGYHRVTFHRTRGH